MTFDSRLLSGIGVISAVVEAGSFVRAGEVLGLTQPAVSRAVARLEERVGLRIFHRSARSIRLTEEGKRFYEKVLPHLNGIEEAAIEAGGSAVEVRGTLRVSTDGAFGHNVLTPNIQPFLERHPALSVHISVREGVGDLVAGGFDLAIHFGPPETSSASCELVFETRVLTCASPAYLERHGIPMHPTEIESGHQSIAMRDPLTGRPYAWEFVKGGQIVSVRPTTRLMVSDTGSLLGACLGGQGIAQPLELYSREFLRSGRMIEILPDWNNETFPLYVYHASPGVIPAKVRAFLSWVRELLRPAARAM
jgi:DNA-binding transcriptional LysR family regulator